MLQSAPGPLDDLGGCYATTSASLIATTRTSRAGVAAAPRAVCFPPPLDADHVGEEPREEVQQAFLMGGEREVRAAAERRRLRRCRPCLRPGEAALGAAVAVAAAAALAAPSPTAGRRMGFGFACRWGVQGWVRMSRADGPTVDIYLFSVAPSGVALPCCSGGRGGCPSLRERRHRRAQGPARGAPHIRRCALWMERPWPLGVGPRGCSAKLFVTESSRKDTLSTAADSTVAMGIVVLVLLLVLASLPNHDDCVPAWRRPEWPTPATIPEGSEMGREEEDTCLIGCLHA